MRLLGIDYGTRRIGLALSDPSGTLASPWRTISTRSRPADAVAQLMPLISELETASDGLAAVVIGLPRRLSGEPNEQTTRVRAFISELATHTALPIIAQDERLTSHEAESRLATRHRDWRSRKAKIDAAAAAIILQDYLDGQGDTWPHPPE